jgi:tetratricopeptide (TPR) repeat protein
VIVLAAIGTYQNSFSGPFILDDAVIAENPAIHRLWPIWVPLFPPDDQGYATDRRPMTNLSLAINYGLGGTRVPGYHVFNLAIHILGGLTLFGVVRRSLRLPALRLASAATPLALITVLIWIVHPLQTNAVTYIIQRTEVLAGLFYLLTLYCVLLGTEADRSLPWYLAAVVSCFLAMGSKESAFSAPVVVLLYDRLFLAGSWREIRQRRCWLYVGLASAWIVPALYVGHAFAVVAAQPARHVIGSGEAGWMDYALAQFESITHYLRLSFWPQPLILDYGPGGVKTFGQVAPCAAFVLALMAGTLFSLWRHPALGFLGVWFFAILAPSSSIIPIHAECAAEKRMYLPLAAVVLMTVVAVHGLGKRWLDRPKTRRYGRKVVMCLGYALACAAVTALILVSQRRNEDYRSALAIWQDTVAKRPHNPRAHLNLGIAFVSCGQFSEAITHCQKALDIAPEYAEAHNNLGLALAGLGQVDEAIEHYRKALEIKPDYAAVHNNLGNTLVRHGRVDEGIAHYRTALEIKPDYAEAHNNLGLALAGRGQANEAISHYRKALESKPDYAIAHNNLGNTLVRHGQVDEAIVHYRNALEINPDYVEAHKNLGSALAGCGQVDEAIAHYRKALEISPDYATAHNMLGNALVRRGQVDEAIAHYRKALDIKPDYVDARYGLGNALLRRGQVEEAIAHYRKALEIKPDLAEVLNNMAWIRATHPDPKFRDGPEAVTLARRVIALSSANAAALDTLAAAYAEAGRFADAVQTARKALDLATQQNEQALAESIQAKIQLYQARMPFHEPPSPPAKTAIRP